MLKKLSVNMGNMLLSLSEIIDIANPHISYHQQRTAFIATQIALAADVNQNTMETILSSALLHDIGAITIEEKTLVHQSKHPDMELHCIRGEALLNNVPWSQNLATIVRNHHTNWINHNGTIDDKDIFISQIINLSDYVERNIDRNNFILHQRYEIIEKVKKLENIQVHSKIIRYFIETSKKEEFWLNLTSKHLYSYLLKNWPCRNIFVSTKEVSQLADLFKEIIDFKSPFTATHTTGVEASTEKISQLFGFSKNDIQQLKLAGAFHDIGKLTISDHILNKPAFLSEKETEIMKSHVYYTYYTLCSIGGLQHIAEWAAFHHEKSDGSGYPFHYYEDELSVGSKIITIADIFTALTEDRPYRKGMNKKEIFDIFMDYKKSKLIDSKLIEILLDNYDEIEEYVKKNQRLARSLYNNIFQD